MPEAANDAIRVKMLGKFVFWPTHFSQATRRPEDICESRVGVRGLAIMPIFRPIDCGLAFKTSLSTLERLVLDGRALQADFLIPEDTSRQLRASFADVEITRTLDEMPFSTEETEKWVGLQSEHFAYEVTDAHFWRSQSWALKLAVPDLKHYCFITGWICLDVISKHPPTFSVIAIGEDTGNGQSWALRDAKKIQ